ncbi:MAG: serine/threonine protein kinase [Spartobacteria bacterium]|nr:serine/threonine protein kinase [Spartobacteria bacterium]
MVCRMQNDTNRPDFDHLTPDVVLNLVEETLGRRCSNICRPLNSYINRVYEVQMEDGDAVIPKFYRPGRWSREALQDEHDFMLELHHEEIPVIPPIRGEDGATIFEHGHTYFTIFEKKGGRICDEPSHEQWRELGHLLGRVHLVGAQHPPRDRVQLTPEACSIEQIDYILSSGFVTRDHRNAYEQAARETIKLIIPLFDGVDLIRIHGDCHRQNIIHRPEESFYMIDFDDMALGPAIQDVWMLLPGRLQDSVVEMDHFLEGYETFTELDKTQLRLIEPLRAMRFIHFTAWCVRQAADGGFTRLSPGWGESSYWQQETRELIKEQTEIRDALEAPALF